MTTQYININKIYIKCLLHINERRTRTWFSQRRLLVGERTYVEHLCCTHLYPWIILRRNIASGCCWKTLVFVKYWTRAVERSVLQTEAGRDRLQLLAASPSLQVFPPQVPLPTSSLPRPVCSQPQAPEHAHFLFISRSFCYLFPEDTGHKHFPESVASPAASSSWPN